MPNANKSLKIALSIVLGFIAVLFLYTILSIDFGSDDEIFEVKVYFFNPSTNEIEYETRNIILDMDSAEKTMVGSVYAEFNSGPTSKHLIKALNDDKVKTNKIKVAKPMGIPFDFHTRSNKVEVFVSKEYKELSPTEELIFRTTLVYTLTELPFVKEVEILVQNGDIIENIVQKNDKKLGALNRDNVLLMPKITSDQAIAKRVVLYFPNKDLTGLEKETRIIQIPSMGKAAEEKTILEELLMKGPESDKLTNLFPSDIKIEISTTDERICYINLSASLDTKFQLNEKAKDLLIYSIVNTLTLSDSNIKKVQFFVNNEKTGVNSQPYEKDESYIVRSMDEDLY